MCFNLSLQLKKARMEARFSATYPEEAPFISRYFASAFERPLLPVLTTQQPDRFQLMRWGLIPSWAKTDKDAQAISLKTLNARAESITQKPSFRLAVRSNRCIIPTTGFFEWQHIHKLKVPWFIGLKGGEPFSFAGLWNEWANPETGEISNTFTVITTEASPLMAKIHNTKKRMPVILTEQAEREWLVSHSSIDSFPDTLTPVDDTYLEAYTVSALVSQSKINRDIPAVLLPHIYSLPAQLPGF